MQAKQLQQPNKTTSICLHLCNNIQLKKLLGEKIQKNEIIIFLELRL